MRGALAALLILLLAGAGWAEPHARGGKARAGGAKARVVRAPRMNSTDEEDEDQVDGSKLFTADTETTPEGEFSFSAAYVLSAAHEGFDGNGNLASLGTHRRADLWLGALTAGLTDKVDITFVLGFAGATDLFAPDADSSLIYSHRFAPSNLQAIARWRFWEDQEEHRSLALVGGPGLLSIPLLEDVGYRASPSFPSWSQSLVFRQDFAPFSADLELLYNFPLNSNPNQFSIFGANLGLGWNADETFLPIVELNYAQISPYNAPVQESLGVTVGLVVKPTEDTAFNLGVQKTVLGRNIENFTTYVVGGSLNF